MRVLPLIFLGAAASARDAHRKPSRQTHTTLVEPRQASASQPYLITGLPVPPGQPAPPRLEVRDLANTGPQWTLFLLAMSYISQTPLSTNVSAGAGFVDIGGIHGLPYARWPGDPNAPATAVRGTTWQGYCTHASVTFPTWHRPYTMALEQSLYQAAMKVYNQLFSSANQTSDQQQWLLAAQTLRLPFWDWTDPRTATEGLPSLFMQPTLTVVMPGNKSATMPNPLEHYSFGSKRPSGFANEQSGGVEEYYQTWNRTYRWPSSNPTPTQDYNSLNSQLMQNAASLRDSVRQLFSIPLAAANGADDPRYWDDFSNTAFQSGSGNAPPLSGRAGSLEDPHNVVHVILGGNAYMSDPRYAGFDPIFFMHHSNVDRIYALWEYVYTDYRIGNSASHGYRINGRQRSFVQQSGTWNLGANAKLTDGTVLAPFRMSNGAYWTSEDAYMLNGNSSVSKGYTYQPVNGVAVDAPTGSLSDRTNALAQLQAYFDPVGGTSSSRKSKRQGVASYRSWEHEAREVNGEDCGCENGSTSMGSTVAASTSAPASSTRVSSASPSPSSVPATSSSSPPPSGYHPLPNTHAYAVSLHLPTHALSGSYLLQLYHSRGNDSYDLVGTSGVFARGGGGGGNGNGTGDEAGMTVQTIVPISSAVVNAILASSSNSTSPPPQTNSRAVARQVSKYLTARLTLPDGTPVAVPSGSGSGLLSHGVGKGGKVNGNETLADDKKPKFTILCADVAHPIGQLAGPHVYYNWVGVNNFLNGSWHPTLGGSTSS